MNCTKSVPGLLIAILLVSGMPGCKNVENYLDPDGPRFSGNYAPIRGESSVPFSGQIKVVSYNIKHSINIAGALAELETVEELKGTDVVMLQEMDEVGADSIAKTIGFNYVYYPAIVHSSNNRNFGNAVLSRYPIVDDGKVILPYEDIKREQKRIAVFATIDIEGLLIRVYSVHTENLWLSPNKRFLQADSVLKSIPISIDHVIVGGDFNTADPITLAATPKLFIDNDYEWATREVGSTVKIGPVGVISDFIFTKGFRVVNAGRVEDATASDHLPVWANLVILRD